MSNDKMQDVFPIVFDYGQGEQATAQKLTGLVKHTDSALSRMAQGIGDPWDYASHTGSGGAYSLSLTNLSQASLARSIGSSDWMSPWGGCWNEANATSIAVVLRADRNSWTLGFPLVSLGSAITETSTATPGVSVIPIDWAGGAIVATGDTDGVLTIEVATPQLVVADGHFYVDYYKGTITAYKMSSVAITLTITGLYMFGPGVPWATQNVIPNWTSTTLCTLALVSSTATTSTYTLTFPQVKRSTRRGLTNYQHGQNPLATWTTGDTYWDLVSGFNSYYRLPPALTAAGLGIGNTIPEGFCLLWDGDELTGRVIPQVTFKYKNANSITLVTPLNWLTAGSANYRLITSGSSAAENINYLMQMTRNNEHVGLTNNPTIGYTIPLSHDNLENRFSSDTTGAIYQFRESSYPTNPHPQYLHRGGYMTNDATGNTANAMRGHLVLATNATGGGFYVGSYPESNGIATFGIGFGGGEITQASETQNTGIILDSLYFNNTWAAGRTLRSPLALSDTGAAAHSHFGNVSDKGHLGSLSIYPGYSGTVSLRGRYDDNSSNEMEQGAVLGFDLGTMNEGNHIRLLEGIRDGTYDVINLPAKMATQTDHTEVLTITPLLSGAPGATKRLAPEQMREFRFRGVPKVDSALNFATDSIAGTNVRADSALLLEFQEHFTSPGIVGADFFNVYSNAIFFSDTGEGMTTSFTDIGEDWLNGTGTFNTNTPSGIYFVPYSAPGSEGAFVFSIHDGAANSLQPFILSDTQTTLNPAGNLKLRSLEDQVYLQSAYGDGEGGNVYIDAGYGAASTGSIYMTAATLIGITSATDIDIVMTSGNLSITGLQTFADNAAALAGGLLANDIYNTAVGAVMIVVAP